VKAIAIAEQSTPEAVNDAIERLFLTLAKGASAGSATALEHLRTLQRAILDREEQGATLSRLLPGGLAEKLRADPSALDTTERLEVTVLLSDVRGYSAIAERTDPTVLASQLNEHRQAMNTAILDQGGTVMQYVGDAVMAVFGAPFPHPDHARCAIRAALEMHAAQDRINVEWSDRGIDEFGLGIGLSTGDVAAAILGSDERIEYTVVGDTVNLSQRLQDLARPAGRTVVSGATVDALGRSSPANGDSDGADDDFCFESLGEQLVKGRDTPVAAHLLIATRGGRA
jgi:class 3 adenylate cyclase